MSIRKDKPLGGSWILSLTGALTFILMMIGLATLYIGFNHGVHSNALAKSSTNIGPFSWTIVNWVKPRDTFFFKGTLFQSLCQPVPILNKFQMIIHWHFIRQRTFTLRIIELVYEKTTCQDWIKFISDDQ
jgi:hypothetical protein